MASAFETYYEGSSHHRESSDYLNVLPQQRWISMGLGAGLAAFGLSKLSIRALAALGAGGYLVYRGATGHCPLSQCLAESGLLSGAGGGAGRPADFEYTGPEHSDLDSFIDRDPPDARSLREFDAVDEAAMESFPASDAPSHTGTAATPSKPIE